MKIKFKIFFPREFMDHHLQDKNISVSVTSERTRRLHSQPWRNWNMQTWDFLDHKRCYLGGGCVCLCFRKPKLWNWWTSKVTCMLAFFSFSSFYRLIFYFYTQTFALWYFPSSCKPGVLFWKDLPLSLLCFLHSSSDTEGLFSSCYYWWMTGWTLRTVLKDH